MRKIPEWDDYFMSIADAISKRSKDPSTQVGAVLVDPENRIIGTGYNGMPSGMKETNKLWDTKDKYDYVIHAEMNAILHSVKSSYGAKLYSTMYPCKECAKLIASSKIKHIFYRDDKYLNNISEDMFKRCGIITMRMTDGKTDCSNEDS